VVQGHLDSQTGTAGGPWTCSVIGDRSR